MICKICGRELKNLRGLKLHIAKHELTVYEYNERFSLHPTCCVCGKPCLFKGKYRRTCGSKSCIQKLKEATCLSRLGVSNPSQSDEIKKKKENTCFSHYGVKNPQQLNEIRERAEQTCLDKYGAKKPAQNKEIGEKIKKTCLEKYGVKCYLKKYNRKELGLPGPMKGKHHTEHTKQLLSKKFKGRRPWNVGIPLSKEAKLKLSKFNKGRRHTEESKRKMRFAARLRKPYFRSKGEKEMCDFIKSKYSGVVLECDRDVLGGWEIDCFIPELKLGFEYQGVYWHSREEVKKRDKIKRKICNEMGITLVEIWSDLWETNIENARQIICNFIEKGEQKCKKL